MGFNPPPGLKPIVARYATLVIWLANKRGQIVPQVVTDFPYPVRVIENIFIPMPDGIRLAATLWLPETTEKVPAILEYLPYRKREGSRGRDHAMHGYLAGHGYACVRLDIRGTGDSDGLIDDEYTPQEQADGVAAIAWLAAQGWCDGQVAMYGISWGGFNGLQIAALRPPALKTIITVGSTDDRYATDIHWIGGCLSKDNFDWSATMFAMNDLPPDPVIVGDRWRDMWQARIASNQPWANTWFRHQRRDDFWKQGSVAEDLSRITIPVFAVSGWADNYSESVPRLLAGLKGPRKGLIGPWAHSFPHDVTVEPAIGWLQEVVRWCDHWLRGIDTGLMQEPMYRVWMQDHVRAQTCYRDRPGRWVAEHSWPSPRTQWQRHFLDPQHRLGPDPKTGHASICSPLWVGLTAGEVGRYGADADWPPDQRMDDGGSLVFVSEPMPEKTEILGAPQLHLRFSVDKPQALVAVRLNCVAPDGQSTRITVGLLNLTHRDSHEHAAALVRGQVYDAVVDLDDTAYAIPPGHRIAVSLSTTYWPIAWPSPQLATLTLHTAQSWLDLPVRPFDRADATLRPFGPPQSAPRSPETEVATPSAFPRAVRHDLLSGVMTVDFPRWTYETHMPDIATTSRSAGYARHIITDGDPLSARSEVGYSVDLERSGVKASHISTGVLTCDATHFRLQTNLTVLENDAPIFQRSWDERIARDMV